MFKILVICLRPWSGLQNGLIQVFMSDILSTPGTYDVTFLEEGVFAYLIKLRFLG